MIAFELTQEQKDLQRLAREFTEKEIIPIAQEYDEKEEVPWDLIPKAHAAGLMNLNIPVEYGGQGLDHVTELIVSEELSRGCAGIATMLGANGLAVTPILIAGTEEQKRKYLTYLCEKPRLAAFGLTEPDAGSDVASIATTATPDGNSYILNGVKHFITNGGIADLYTIFATVDRSRGVRGISAFIVPGDTPGLRMGKKERKMGIRASHTGEVILEEVRVPKENLLGNEGQGFRIAMQTLDRTRPGVGIQGVGIARAAYEAAVKYAKERIQFGKPIAANQAIQFMLADMAMLIDAARLLCWRAAWQIDAGNPSSLAGSMAKAFATDVAMKVTTEALQIFGGYGYMRDYPMEKYMRDAKIHQIFEGTNQIQRVVMSANILQGRL